MPQHLTSKQLLVFILVLIFKSALADVCVPKFESDSADLTADEANRLIDRINRKADADAAKTYERKAIDALPKVISPSEYHDGDEPF